MSAPLCRFVAGRWYTGFWFFEDFRGKVDPLRKFGREVTPGIIGQSERRMDDDSTLKFLICTQKGKGESGVDNLFHLMRLCL